MIDTKGLKDFLETLSFEDIAFYRKIEEANTIDELNKFGYEGNLQPNSVIGYGEYFLVDYYGNDLTIVKLTKKKYKNNKGRLVACKPCFTIIEDCKKQYGSCINGYFKIPDRFIIK